MRHLGIAFLALVLLAGCKRESVRTFWNDVPLLEDDIRVSEDRLAQFAQLAVQSPEDDALASMDVLFNRLKEDEVAYYVYADWMDAAFYNIYSPCRSAALYAKAVDRMVVDGIITGSTLDAFLQKREWIQYNQAGVPATVPGTVIATRTLVLVLDVGCPSCREALVGLASLPEWADVRRIAVCCGYGATPAVPGWEYVTDPHAADVFDVKMTPVYFVVAPDGTVETSYALAL